MGRGSGHNNLSGLATEAGLILLAAGTPLALGGVHQLTIIIASLLACATLACLWVHRRGHISVPWFGWVLIGVTAYTALQMVPLPVGLLRLIAPASVELLEVSLASAGGLGSVHPISLDPGATLWETLKIGSCALAFIIAHNHLHRRDRRNRLLLAVVLTGVLVTFLGFIGAVAAPGKPLMLYEPQQTAKAAGLIVTSFVNPNHGSMFLVACTVLAVGLAIGARDLQRRVLLILAGTLLGAGVFMTLSRGGMVALAVGLGALAVLLAWRHSAATSGKARVWAVPAALALILGLSAWLAYDSVLAELRTMVPDAEASLGKVELWPSGLAMLGSNLWVGVGRGAFASAFPRYLSGEFEPTKIFSHLENQYLHLPAELGLVGVLLILATAVAAVLWARRLRSSPKLAAALAMLGAAAVHELFDFSLETLGLAMLAAAVAGLVSAGQSSARSGQSSGRHRALDPRAARHRRLGLALAGALVLALTPVAAIRAASDGPDVATLLQQDPSKPEALGKVQAAIRRQPAEPFLQLAGARVLLAQRKPQALAWLNRALFLFPDSPAVHLEAARALLRFGRRPQALLEYRLALTHGAPVRGTVSELLAHAKGTQQIRAALPERAEQFVVTVQLLLRAKRVEEAGQLSQRAAKRWPSNDKVLAVRVEALVAAKDQRAAQVAQALCHRRPTPSHYRLWAKAARLQGSGRVVVVLEHGRELFVEDEMLSLALAEAYVDQRQTSKAQKLAEQVLARASSTRILVAAHSLLARIHRAQGRPHRARYEAEQARKIMLGR